LTDRTTAYVSEDPADKIKAALALLQEAALSGKAEKQSSPTVEALSARYLREYARHQKSANDKAKIAKILNRLLGSRPSLSLTNEDIEDYRDRRRQRPTRLGGPVSPGTLNREVSQLRHMLNWAVKLNLIPHNPIVKVEMEREDNVRRSMVRSERELRAILGQLDTSTMRALVLFLIDTGRRVTEAITLRWEQIDFKRSRVELWATKNDDPSVFKFSRRAKAALLGLFKDKKGPWVFPSPTSSDRHIARSYALRKFQQACENAEVYPAAGDGKLHLHDLRHSMIWRSRVRDKAPEKMVMKQTGHKTRSAYDRYGIGDYDELDELYKIADENIEREEREALIRKSASKLQVAKPAPLTPKSDKSQGQD
jgi:integrase